MAMAGVLVALALLTACASLAGRSTDTLPPLHRVATTGFAAPVLERVLVAPHLAAEAPAPTTTEGGPTTPTGLPPLPPAPVARTGARWGNWSYYAVPSLTTLAERGTGCGTGAIGNVLPDGIWNVLIGDGSGSDIYFTATTITVDLRCIFTWNAGRDHYAAVCGAHPVDELCSGQSAQWFAVNSSTQLRTMPLAPRVLYGIGALGKSPCPEVSASRTSPGAPWRYMDNWIVVVQGVVTTVITACPVG